MTKIYIMRIQHYKKFQKFSKDASVLPIFLTRGKKIKYYLIIYEIKKITEIEK